MAKSKSAFVPSVPVPGSRKAHKSRRKHTCPRSAAVDPPPEKPDESQDALVTKRAKLEKMFKGTLEPNVGKTGQCECIWCGGTKKRRCSWCEGKGYRMELRTKSWEEISEDIARMQATGEPMPMPERDAIPVQCSACSGTKKLRCAYCRGSGIGSYGHAY